MLSNYRVISFAVLGLGFIGRKHCFFIEQNPNSQLNATIDPNVDESDYATIEEFVSADGGNTDVICIASPNGAHLEHAKYLIDYGYHVIIEKPMAIDSDGARELVDYCSSINQLVFMVMQNRYSPISKWLKDLIDKQLLGSIFMVQINAFWNRDERYYKAGSWHGSKELDGGTLLTQFSHFVDLLYWCFGDISEIQADLFNFNHQELIDFEDSARVNFKFVNSGYGQINYSTSCFSKNLESTITILAEKGTIKIGGQYMDEVLHCEIKDYELPDLSLSKEKFGPYTGNAANHRFVIQNAVEVLNGVGSPDTSLQEGAAVVDIIDRIYKSSSSLIK
ncbi:MAG: Gfo/Idh/MocA family oxidoreductase [Bacteroidia bacterium]